MATNRQGVIVAEFYLLLFFVVVASFGRRRDRGRNAFFRTGLVLLFESLVSFAQRLLQVFC